MARLGYLVDTFAEAKSPIFRSRFCNRRFLAPSWHNGEAFFAALDRVVEAEEYDGIFICNEDILEALATRSNPVAWKGLLLADRGSLWIAFSKNRATMMAREIGVPVPRTVIPNGEHELERFAHELAWPLVIKGEKGEAGRKVRLVRRMDELIGRYREVVELEREYGGRPALQEFVAGVAYSAGGLFCAGIPLRVCTHRKLLTYPPPYGGKTVKGVTERCPELLEEVFKIFARLNYTGLGHVEFIRDARDGRFRFLEINPRLWGTIGVAEKAGVDLFGAYMDLVTGRRIKPDLRFREGVSFHFLGREARLIVKRPARLFGFIADCLNPGIRSDFMWSDPGPHLRLRTAG